MYYKYLNIYFKFPVPAIRPPFLLFEISFCIWQHVRIRTPPDGEAVAWFAAMHHTTLKGQCHEIFWHFFIS